MRTKDEHLIIRLYELGNASGDVNQPFDRYEVGQSIGLSARTVDTICALLFRTNFIRKGDDHDIYLTDNGEKLALRLLDE